MLQRVIEWAVERQRIVLGIIAVVTVLFGLGLPKIQTTTAPDAFVIEGSAEGEEFGLFRDTFGVQDQGTVLVRLADPFDEQNLARLDALQSELVAVPHMFAARSILDVGDFTAAGFEERVRAVETLDGRLFSESANGGFVAVAISMASFDEGGDRLTPAQISEHASKLISVVDSNQSSGFEPIVFSSVALGVASAETVGLWMGLGIGLLLLAVVVFLWMAYGSWRASVLPLFIIVVALVWTLGLLGHFSITLNAFTQLLILLIMIAGVADGIHLLHGYAHQLAPAVDQTQLATDAVVFKGPAIMFTSLTTAAGFFSFVFVDYIPLAQIGAFGAFGVIVAMLITLAVGPVVLERVVGDSVSPPTRLDKPLERVVETSYRNRWVVLGATMLLLVVSFFGINRVELGFDILGWIGNAEAVETIETIEELVDGTGVAEVVVITSLEDGVFAPDFVERLRRIDQVMTNSVINEDRQVALPSLLTVLDQGLGEGGVKGAALANGFVTDDGRTVRMSYASAFFDGVDDGLRSAELQDELQSFIGPEDRLVLTGGHLATLRSGSTALRTTVQSYGVALLVVSLLLVLMLRSVSRGLIAMIPNLLPAFFLLGLMGILGIAIDPLTILAGGIVIGISVDDTVHLTHSTFRSAWAIRDQDAGLDNLLRATRDSGTSIFVTSLVTGVGFAVFMLFPQPAIKLLGGLCAMAIAAALFADLVVLPALLSLLNDIRSGSRKSFDAVR